MRTKLALSLGLAALVTTLVVRSRPERFTPLERLSADGIPNARGCVKVRDLAGIETNTEIHLLP